MRKSNYDWQLNEEQPSESFIQMIKQKQLSPLVGQLLWRRGYQEEIEVDRFLHPQEQKFHDPYLIHDMDKAINRIHKAVLSQEKILIYGDYDADGITSTTVMKETLELLGADIETFLPNRFEQGYGPNQQVYQKKIKSGVQLIITVDNGVAGYEAITYAKKQGVDVIVTDHHELPSTLPEAYAIVHPRHPEGNYPFYDLAGVGVVFKVATALLEEPPAKFLDLVAIGTIADMVSMTDENRIFVSLGLETIRHTKRIGLQALFEVSGLSLKEVDETTIGFSIIPRLNAVGRMYDPNPAVNLLETSDEKEAIVEAKNLNIINEERKLIVEEITQEAMTMVDDKNQIHLLAKSGWHEGVLGIVAGKIMQKTGKPTIVLSIKEDGSAKGSGRSIDALNLYTMFDHMRELFTFFGGHHAAVGLTMPTKNIRSLQQKMNEYVDINAIDLSKGPVLMVDEVLELKDVSISFIDELQLLAPFGTENPIPQFLFKNQTAENVKRIGTTQQHLKFNLVEGQTILDVVAFNFSGHENELTSSSFNMVGKLSINEWNGRKKPQLMLLDYSVEGFQVFDWRSKRFRNPSSLVEDVFYLAFEEKALKEVSLEIIDKVTVFETLASLETIIKKKNYQALFVIDCPDDIMLLKHIFILGSFSRLYLLGISPEEAYLNGVGTREQYVRLFKLIYSQEKIDIRYKLENISQYLKIPKKLLIFMIKVFFDLNFVTIEDGILQKVANPESHLLTESEFYQHRLKKTKSEEFLLLSDIPTIRTWLMN